MTWFNLDDGVRVITCLVCLFHCFGSVYPRPFPQDGGTVTQTGEPSHFQVDDKAAEIEVNANPAGVKVNAKPASLQVVAKPGTPAVPIFHPSIHLAQHYAPPPVIHHQPATFYHGCFHFPYCHNWFYNGIKREKFPRPQNVENNIRTHKSNIPRGNKHKKGITSRKRQYISAAPQLLLPTSVGALRGLSAYGAYGYGALPQYAPLSSVSRTYGLQKSPQERLFASPTQLLPQLGLQETGLTRGLVPTVENDQDNPDFLRDYSKLYSELNTLTSMYNAILRQRSLNSLQGLGYGSGLGLGGRTSFNAGRSGLRYVPATLGTSQNSDAMMGYGKAYIPSPLSQLYGSQSSLSQSNGLLGASLVNQQTMSPYLVLSPVLQRSPLVSRSKVPKASGKKAKKPHSGFTKDKRKVDVKRQTLIEPIVPEEPNSMDDLLQDGMSQDYKRQFILTPALETLQQLQPLQSTVSQESLQPQLRQLQLQQLLQEQPLTPQSVGLQPVGMQSIAGVQPLGMQSIAGVQPVGMQQLGISGSQQLRNLLPLESTPLRYLTSSLVPPTESLGSGLIARPQSRFSSRMVSPISSPLMSSSLASPSLMSPLFSNGFSHPRNTDVFQDRSLFRHPLRVGYPGYPRRLLRGPQYRRRLHNFREEEGLGGMQPEILGKEEVTTQGSYTTERVPNFEGETLVNSPVGFGPITVEAKTAEGARMAQADQEDKRHNIHKPVLKNHRRKSKDQDHLLS